MAKFFDYSEYRKNRVQVNFLLRRDTVEKLAVIAKEFAEKGIVPQQSLPCLAKLGLKVIEYLHGQNPNLLSEVITRVPLKKGEL